MYRLHGSCSWPLNRCIDWQLIVPVTRRKPICRDVAHAMKPTNSFQPSPILRSRILSPPHPVSTRIIFATAKKSQQQAGSQSDDNSEELDSFFADSPRWRWPFSSGGQQSGLQSAAKRLYQNKDLRALVEQASPRGMIHDTSRFRCTDAAQAATLLLT